MPADRLLERLERAGRVKQTGPGRWIAQCPAHADRSPSLSIRELDDGRVLIHDFRGCEPMAVLDAVGLDWCALFPPGQQDYAPSRSRIPARDLLELIQEETSMVAFITAVFLSKRQISPEAWDRLARAARRIDEAREMAGWSR
jgi:hypothetical protein